MRRLGPYLSIAAIVLAPQIRIFAQNRASSAAPVSAALSSDKNYVPSTAEQALFALLNQEREKAGLNKLAWNDQLARAAREHSRLLAENRTLSHQLPSEAPLMARLAAAGARFTAAAENVADGGTPDEIHDALMHSRGHRANIMSPDYNSAGVGVVETQGHLFVTQDFALALHIYSEAEFRDTLIASVNRSRKAKGLAALDARADPSLRSAACSTNGEAMSVPAGINAPAEVVTFTLSEPDKLPDSFTKYVQTSRWHRMGVGVCFRPDQTYGSGNFWVVVAFGS
ncbi:MAG TPA: CAP domain-containing protein [Terriglobales bacterium]|nr:CAP domain-containing protein [Terriglobales bacterium]